MSHCTLTPTPAPRASELQGLVTANRHRCHYVGCPWRAVWQPNVAHVGITVPEVRDVGRSDVSHAINSHSQRLQKPEIINNHGKLTYLTHGSALLLVAYSCSSEFARERKLFLVFQTDSTDLFFFNQFLGSVILLSCL